MAEKVDTGEFLKLIDESRKRLLFHRDRLSLVRPETDAQPSTAATNRALALAVTKIDEAVMWLDRAGVEASSGAG